MAERMRAAVRTRFGHPEVVSIEQVGPPWSMRLLAGWRRPRTAVLGTEFAGVVDATGPGVSRFGVGDRVCGYWRARSGRMPIT